MNQSLKWRNVERRLVNQLNADESVSELIEEWATIDQLCPVVADKSDEEIVNEAMGETDDNDTDVVLEEDTVRSIPSVSGQNPTGQNPTGQNPYGQNPTGQNPTGQNPTT